MRLLYSTDLHGSTDKYDRIYDIARETSVQAVINGGDMLPHGKNLFISQKTFLTEFLDYYFDRFDSAGIDYLCMPGNDDIMAYDILFESIIADHTHVKNIAQDLVCLSGYEFIGMNRVADYPFRLKDRCRMDTPDFKFPVQYGPSMISQENGEYREIPDWKRYVRGLPTIEDELELLPLPSDFGKSVYVIHMPPASLGLDVCEDMSKIGSRAVYNFLKIRQPLLSLHGHIHESPDMTGKWKEEIGDTVCIQPGQKGALTYVIIDLETMSAERRVE